MHVKMVNHFQFLDRGPTKFCMGSDYGCLYKVTAWFLVLTAFGDFGGLVLVQVMVELLKYRLNY